MQKEINQLSGKLERVFMVTDEQVFKVSLFNWRVFKNYQSQ